MAGCLSAAAAPASTKKAAKLRSGFLGGTKVLFEDWVVLRGSGEAAQVARSALAVEVDRRVAEEQPAT